MADVSVSSGYKWAALDQQMSIAKGGWAVQRYGIDKQYKLGMANLKFQEKRLRELEIPELELRERMRQDQVNQFEQQIGLAKDQFAFQIVQFEASLGGPQNWVQASNAARGLQNAGIAGFAERLRENQAAGPAFGETSTDLQSNRTTMDSLINKITGQENAATSGASQQGSALGTASIEEDPTYKAISDVLARGGRSMAAGTVESLDPNELAMMQSVAQNTNLGEAGFMRWLRDYQRSRVGTENPVLA